MSGVLDSVSANVYSQVLSTLTKQNGHEKGIEYQLSERIACLQNSSGNTDRCLFSVRSYVITAYVNVEANWFECTYGNRGMYYETDGINWQTCFINYCTTFWGGLFGSPPSNQTKVFN